MFLTDNNTQSKPRPGSNSYEAELHILQRS